jgi:hypothetical protein
MTTYFDPAYPDMCHYGIPAAMVPGLRTVLAGGQGSLAKHRILDARCSGCDGRIAEVVHLDGTDWLLYQAARWTQPSDGTTAPLPDKMRRDGTEWLALDIDHPLAVWISPACKCGVRQRTVASEFTTPTRAGKSRVVFPWPEQTSPDDRRN